MFAKPKITSIWDLISLSVLIAPYTGIYNLLDGKIELLISLFLCLTIEKNIKRLTHKWIPHIFKRPDGALDCSILNDGGPVGDRGGFPSGHVATASLFANLYYLNNENADNNTFLLYNLFPLIMGIARYMKGCHNIYQIIAGYVLGFSIAYGFYIFKKRYVNKNKSKNI